MDSGDSGSLRSSSDDHESPTTLAADDHSSFFLPPFQQQTSSSAFYGDPKALCSSDTYRNFVNYPNQNHLLPPKLPPHHHPPSSSFRNPRKRTRASRKAPTTVLTTDTSNFKAMVQEFTGVPTSPFSTPFSSTTRRLDISRSPTDPFTFNPFRPIPQKPHHQQPLIPSSSSLINHHHQNTISMTFPYLPLPQNHQVSTFQRLLSHQHHHPNHHTTVSSLQELDSINIGALQQNHHPTADDDHQLMMTQFSEFDHRTEKASEIQHHMSSSSSAPIEGTSGTTTTTTTITVDPWICLPYRFQ